MSGYCNECGNTLCLCSDMNKSEEPIKSFSVEYAETIRDALYLARIMIHDEKIIKDPFSGSLSKDRIKNVLEAILIKEKKEGIND